MSAAGRAWDRGPATPLLAAQQVHVYGATLDLDEARLSRMAHLLSDDEAARAARFCFEGDRRRFTAARGLLRTILARYVGAAPQDLHFVYGPHGKPALHHSTTDVRFNVSHSCGIALFAVARDINVGIDVEGVRDIDAEALASRYFSAAESRALLAVSQADQLLAFFNCWTRKEAYLKALGDGLGRPLDSFDVSPAPGAPARLLWTEDAAGASGWSIRALTPAPHFAAALAIPLPEFRLSCWTETGSMSGSVEGLLTGSR